MWTLALAFAATAASVSGEYRSVTETEYAIELSLQPSGKARLDFATWEADGAAAPSNESYVGTWSQSGPVLELDFNSGRSARFQATACLPYSEFGKPGCSPGLRLISTTFPKSYGLQRFGLWRSDSLQMQP